MKKLTFVSLLVVAAVSPFLSFGADCVYLKPLGAGEERATQDGASWATAYAGVTEAMDAAIVADKPIHAAGGVYVFPAVRELTSVLAIYGGFPGVNDAETLDDRDPSLYETVFTGDIDLDDVWQHCVTNSSYGLTNTKLEDKPIVSNGKLNLPPAFTEDFDTYAPSKNNANAAGAFMVLSGGALTVDGVTFSGFYNTNNGGPQKSGDATSAILMFVAGAMNVSNCRFIGNTYGQGAIYTRQNMTVEDCDILYNWGGSRGCGVTQHARFTTLRRCRFVSIPRTNSDSSRVINCWGGDGFDLFDCVFARCVQAMGSGYNSNYGGPSNVYGGEGAGRGNFQDCVISNCYTATSSSFGPVLMGGNGYWHMNRCVVANNLGVCKPTADKAFCLIGTASATDRNRRVYESTTFVGNEMRAQDVSAASGSYALGILGNNVKGSDTQFLNCTFDGNRAVAPDKANVTKLLCRGVVTFAATADSTAQTGLANCTFTGPHEEGVYEIVQFGAGHTKDIYFVNCLFDAEADDMTDPVYADVPRLVHFVNSSVLNCLLPNPEMNYEGLGYDKVPLVRTVVDEATGRYVYLPGAKVPYLRDTCDVATNHTTLPMSWVFRRPGSSDWVALASNTGKNGNGWDQKLVTDATDAARPAGSFTRGAVQALTDAATNGKSLVLRRDPFAAGAFAGPTSQTVATGDPIVPVTAVSTDEAVYTFDGWYDEGGVKVADAAKLTTVSFMDEDYLVLTAKFEVPDVTLTFDLGECGTFDANGQSTIAVQAKPGSIFPDVPPYTVRPAWHCLGFDLPRTVPTAASNYPAEYVTSDVRRIHVTPEGAGRMDGSDWENAYGDLAAAYADAGKYCGEVWLKKGFYRLAGFIPMKSNVTVLGGFAGDETEAAEADPEHNLSVISGDKDDNDYWQPNGSGGSLAANKIWVDGVYSQPNPDGSKNYYKASGNVSENVDSAFISSGIATNAVFDGIVLTGFKNGAVLATGGLTTGLAFRRCRFLGDNVSAATDTAQSGTVRLIGSALFEDCLFDGCVYAISGVSSTPNQKITVRRSTFSNNYAGAYHAGGIRLQSDMGLELSESRFYRNCNDSRSFQAGSSLAFYGSVGKVEVSDCVFEEELNRGDSHGALVFNASGTYTFSRCRFLRNRRTGENNSNYENIVSTCLAAYGYTPTVLLRDCLFEGNEMRQTNVNCTDNYQWGSVLAGSSGAYTFVNCTFLDNLAESVRDDKSIGTFVVGNASVALVGCVFKDSVLTGPTARKADLVALDKATLGIVDTVLSSSSEGYAALRAEHADWMPNIANSYVQGFDKTAFEPLKANGYLYDVVTAGDADLMSAPQTNDLGVVALGVKGVGPVRGRPTWLAGTTAYIYDAEANAAKPWRKVVDRTSYSASVADLERIPDAFGRARGRKSCSVGPLERPLGLTLIVR